MTLSIYIFVISSLGSKRPGILSHLRLLRIGSFHGVYDENGDRSHILQTQAIQYAIS